MDLIEGVGESSSPPRSFGVNDLRNDIYNRLVETGNEEAVSNPDFRDLLDAHFSRLPTRYPSISFPFFLSSSLSLSLYIYIYIYIYHLVNRFRMD